MNAPSEDRPPTGEPADASAIETLRTKNVFVDTSIHVGAKFVYSSGSFHRLAALAAGDLATVFETEVDLGEIASNIEKAADDAANGLKRFQREAVGLRAVTAPEVAALFHPLGKDHIHTLLMQEFSSYRARARTRQIPLTEADASEVFRRYFSQEPPFEEKKRSEFPDAFIVAALAGWCWSRAELMYVVSQDKGFRAAAATIGRGRLIPLENLDEFLNLVVSEQHQHFAILAQQWLRSNDAVVIQKVTGAFLDAGFYVEDADGDAEDIDVEEFRCARPLLVEVNTGEAVFSLACDATFTAVLTYDDPYSGIYDPEDDVMLFTVSKSIRVRRTEEIDAEVRILFHDLEEPEGGAPLDTEVEIEEIRLNRGRDIPVSIEDELVEVFPSEDDDWFLEDDDPEDDGEAAGEGEDGAPGF